MKEVRLTQGKTAMVDDKDYDFLCQFRWQYMSRGKHGDSQGYAASKFGSKTIVYMHRFIFALGTNLLVDHIDGNTLNNQKSNLRLCTSQENTRNRHKRKETQSKYIGLSKGKNRKKWQVQITVSGKRKTIGYFISEEDAARAYDSAAKKYHGEFASRNFND